MGSELRAGSGGKKRKELEVRKKTERTIPLEVQRLRERLDDSSSRHDDCDYELL